MPRLSSVCREIPERTGTCRWALTEAPRWKPSVGAKQISTSRSEPCPPRIAYYFTRTGTSADTLKNSPRRSALLTTTGDAIRAARFLREAIVPRYGGDENEALAPALDLVGPDDARQFPTALVDARFPWKHAETFALLRQLDEEHSESARPAWDEALREGVRAALLALPAWPFPPRSPRSRERSGRYGIPRAGRRRATGPSAISSPWPGGGG